MDFAKKERPGNPEPDFAAEPGQFILRCVVTKQMCSAIIGPKGRVSGHRNVNSMEDDILCTYIYIYMFFRYLVIDLWSKVDLFEDLCAGNNARALREESGCRVVIDSNVTAGHQQLAQEG